jgi:hypothetical protein
MMPHFLDRPDQIRSITTTKHGNPAPSSHSVYRAHQCIGVNKKMTVVVMTRAPKERDKPDVREFFRTMKKKIIMAGMQPNAQINPSPPNRPLTLHTENGQWAGPPCSQL